MFKVGDEVVYKIDDDPSRPCFMVITEILSETMVNVDCKTCDHQDLHEPINKLKKKELEDWDK